VYSRRLAPAREYGFGHQEFASFVGGSWTAYDRNDEVGIRMGDVAGRVDALAIASSEGSALAVAWRGWPVAMTAHAIRHGLELRGNYDIHGPLTLVNIEAGGFSGSSPRAFVDSSFTLRRRRDATTLRIAADSKNHARASVRLGARFGSIRFAVSGEAARRMTIGGVASSITPDAFLIERVIDPALPLAFTRIENYRGARAELTASGLTAFWQRHSANLTVRGLQLTMHSPPMPLVQLPALDLTAGAARARGIRGTKGWLALRWQP
jgi:hypothetical protein